MTATSASWKHLPPPSAREDLAFEAVFTDAELEQIVQGFVPGEMEDKWFIYFEDGWLRVHRSWTGAFIYALRLDKTSDGARVVESWVNRDPQQYQVLNTEYDRRFLRHLIETLLLKRGVTERVYVKHKPSIPARVLTIFRGLIYSARLRRALDLDRRLCPAVRSPDSHHHTWVALSRGPGARSHRRARRGGLYRYLRDGRAGDSGAVRSAAEVCRGRAVSVRPQSDVSRRRGGDPGRRAGDRLAGPRPSHRGLSLPHAPLRRASRGGYAHP